MQENYNIEFENEISFREIFETLWKKRVFIASIIFIFAVISLVFSMFMKSNLKQSNIYISFNYPGIERGTYPDDTNFNQDEIISPSIIFEAYSKLKLENSGIELNEIRKNLKVEAIVPKNIDKIVESELKSGRDYIYFPNKFKIILNHKFKKGKSLQDPDEFLSVLINNYIKHFNQKYSGEDILGNLVKVLNSKDYDYNIYIQIISDEVDKAIHFFSKKSIEESKFRSSTTNLSYFDIVSAFTNYKNIDLADANSFIDANNISKNKTTLIDTYIYKLKLAEDEKVNKLLEQKNYNELISKYEKDSSTVMLSDVSGKNGPIVIQSGENYYDELTKLSSEAGLAATKLEFQITRYKNKIEKLKKDNTNINDSKLLHEQAEQKISVLNNKLNKLLNISNQTLIDQYNSDNADAIQIVSPIVNTSDVKIALNIMIAITLGFVVSIFIVFMGAYLKNEKRK